MRQLFFVLFILPRLRSAISLDNRLYPSNVHEYRDEGEDFLIKISNRLFKRQPHYSGYVRDEIRDRFRPIKSSTIHFLPTLFSVVAFGASYFHEKGLEELET